MIETKFKETEVGRVPADWEVKTISQMSDIITGATPSTSNPQYWDNGQILWMSSGELNNKFIHNVQGRITQIGYDHTGTHMLPKHCVLIGLAGQGKTRGTAAYNEVELCTNQSIAAILPNENTFNSLYLYYYTDSQYEQLRQLSAGDGGRGGLNKQILLNLYIPLPPLPEQRRIATALSDIDSLISSLDELIEKKRNIKQGTMQQLLTGKTRLKGFSEPWGEKKLGEIGYTYNGLSGKSANDFGHGNAQYITFLNILNNVKIDTRILEKVSVDNTERQNAVQKGDLFFNTSSETPEEVGICSVLLEGMTDTYLNSFCFGYRVVDKEVLGLYLSYYFRSRMGRELMSCLAQGSTRYNLSKDSFLKSSIIIPSTISEQRAIASILTSMDDEIAALEQKREKYVSLKQGMMQELLTGRIRLV